MCLSTVYRNNHGNRELICKEIAAVQEREGKLIFTDIMGIPTEVQGHIEQIDLMDNYIIISDEK